ncbi:MAG: hypothetical protein J2P17_28910, partial [Mycobacterium sp.]|nr:hypothetical protein [Mycobacterium sp.]
LRVVALALLVALEVRVVLAVQVFLVATFVKLLRIDSELLQKFAMLLRVNLPALATQHAAQKLARLLMVTTQLTNQIHDPRRIEYTHELLPSRSSSAGPIRP